MRRLTSVEKVIDIRPIENADNIEVATVKGWDIVVKKNEFKVDDEAVYFEVDSWVPNTLAPFLCKSNTPKVYMGVEGERLKTIKLRGQISQGLLLHPSVLIEKGYNLQAENLDEELGVIKYEHVTTNTNNAKGNFPSFIVKTDEERVQNINYKKYLNNSFVLSEKLDGSSLTVYWKDGEFGVCSRNIDLKEDVGSKFWHVVNMYNLREKLNELQLNIALQGELIGHGIQKNRYGINGNDFYVFTMFDINKGEKMSYKNMLELCYNLNLKTVPILDTDYKLPKERSKLIELADGYSKINPKIIREGFVCRTSDSQTSFKVISNKFLLKHQ